MTFLHIHQLYYEYNNYVGIWVNVISQYYGQYVSDIEYDLWESYRYEPSTNSKYFKWIPRVTTQNK